MEKTPNIEDIIANNLNQDKTRKESAADLGATILEMKPQDKYYGKNTKGMTESTQLADIKEEVIHRLLDRTIEKPDQPKKPHLTIVK